MMLRGFRSSKSFVIFVVCVAIFTDTFLGNLVAPVLPYALSERAGLSHEDVQIWNSILLASYGGAVMLGSCTLSLAVVLYTFYAYRWRVVKAVLAFIARFSIYEISVLSS